jgi:hypothetical protein
MYRLFRVTPGLESVNVVLCLLRTQSDYFIFSIQLTVIIMYLHEFHTLTCVTHLWIVDYAEGLFQSRIFRR